MIFVFCPLLFTNDIFLLFSLLNHTILNTEKKRNNNVEEKATLVALSVYYSLKLFSNVHSYTSNSSLYELNKLFYLYN